MAARRSQISVLQYDAAHLAPIVLVSGPEEYLADRAMATVREKLAAEFVDLEIHDVDAAAYGAGELFSLASPSLFAEPRLIRVSAVEKATDAFIADAKNYLQEPAEDTTIILRHSGGQRGKALLDAVRGEPGAAIGAIEIQCPEIKRDQDRAAFVQSEFRRQGAKASVGAVRALVAAYSGPVGELAGAVKQLISDVGSTVSEEHVAQATEGRVEAGAFKVADAATAGRTAEALTLMRHALATGTDAMPMLFALNMKVRAMARVYGARGSAAALAKTFGMAPWQIERAQRETRGWHERDLARAVDLAAETEWLLKGGTRDPQYALERYLIFVSTRGRH